MLQLFRHFSFDRVKIETGAALHWRIIKKGLECLAHYLLDKYKAPELEFEPIEVLLSPLFRPMVWPALALEGIDEQVDEIRPINVRLFTQPAVGLVNEPVLVVVNRNRADGAFARVEDFVTGGWAFAGNGRRLVITIEMVLVSPVTEFHAFEQLVGDVRITGSGEEGWEPIKTREDAVLHGVRCHMTGPAQDARHAEAAFHDCAFALSERRGAAIGPGEGFGPVVSPEDDDGVIVQAKVLE